ncbi:MinD/ParA family protein [Halalkalibacter hemicellulosilyticus]|uniref:Flagellar synthesis regulator FleN n=1 Tax=Halalkalibacter hemicellulosilyticusJCM 9152 TaxID=1236971 RepID=W4QB74_9BACI|nr:MinD/ParA family protein [Halalkalibacter hemicellulosilyticus]GAE29265.1 flagellar synthesis regulator FleN [Halalkalibacter hemicellulosilyticusJCM 9152]
MNDQAENLRKMVASEATKEAKVIAVVSGKGGVGKSNVCLNFALSLTRLGKKVAIFDLDIGMANLDILMGVSSTYTIMDALENELSIWDIIETDEDGLAYIAGGSGFSSFVELTESKIQRFFNQLELIGQHFDYVFLDMGAGATKASMQFILAANEIFVVTTPEPTSITDAYAMVKYIHLSDEHIPMYLLINRAESEKEARDTEQNFKRVTLQFLGKHLLTLGYVPFDDKVTKSVKAQKPFVILYPQTRASQSIAQMASSYLGIKESTPSKFGQFIKKMKVFMNK